MTTSLPLLPNEMERLVNLSELDLDYSGLKSKLRNLCKLAAIAGGTPVALVNFIDADTQWTVSNYGFELDQMAREDSVCQYTIAQDADFYEVKDLQADERFYNKFYVNGQVASFRYYYGVPLISNEGHKFGSLCLLANQQPEANQEKLELLQIISREIVTRLKMAKLIRDLEIKSHDANVAKFKVAHDIRGPLNGIVGLTQIIAEQAEHNTMNEVLHFVSLIEKSSNGIVELADDILGLRNQSNKPQPSDHNYFNLEIFKSKLETLYTPQAINKGIHFSVTITGNNKQVAFGKNKLLQISGNIISNALKFTPQHGSVAVNLELIMKGRNKHVKFTVADTGIGLNEAAIVQLLSGSSTSTDGTSGEKGYGFGMLLVVHLIESLNGSLNITSTPGQGAHFTVVVPVH